MISFRNDGVLCMLPSHLTLMCSDQCDHLVPAPVETPQLYLKLTTRCLNASVVTQPKFNHEQCRYLVDKLTKAVQSAHSFLELINTWYSTFASDEDMVQSLEIFKLLLA